MKTTTRARDLGELLTLLPYQMGYRPLDSLVVVALTGRRIGLIQRYDLLDDPDDCDGAATVAVDHALRHGADAVLVVVYEPAGERSSAHADAVRSAADRRELPIMHDAVVRDGRWFGRSCDGSCCPDDGTELPAPEEVPAVAEFVRLGVSPLADRGAHVARLTAGADHPGEAFGARAGLGLGEATADPVVSWQRVLDPRPGAEPVQDLDEDCVLTLTGSLRDVRVRDALLAVLCPGSIPLAAFTRSELDHARELSRWCPWVDDDGEVGAARVVQERLVDLVRRTPRDLAAPVCTVLGQLVWWLGEGTLASAALEEALAVEPDYRLAQLLHRLVLHGVPARQAA